MTVPSWMRAEDIEEIIEAHREWIASERTKQRPRLRLDPRRVSETEARRAVRELIAMLIDDEAPELGRRAEAHPDPRPALALGILLHDRHALVQLAARARPVRGARLRRRARALPHARGEPLGPVLEARGGPAPRLAERTRTGSTSTGRSCWPSGPRSSCASRRRSRRASPGAAGGRRRRRARRRAPRPCAADAAGMVRTSPAETSTTSDSSSPSQKRRVPSRMYVSCSFSCECFGTIAPFAR